MEKRDLDFILNILQGRPSDTGGVDWYAVMGFLELNRVTVPFYNRAVTLGIDLPPQVKRKCVNVLGYQRARNAGMREYAERIGKELVGRGIGHVFLKGAVMANYAFPKADTPVIPPCCIRSGWSMKGCTRRENGRATT